MPTYQSTLFENGQWVTQFENEHFSIVGFGDTAFESLTNAKFHWENK